MNNFEIVIQALALVFNTWTAYANAGIMLLKESFLRKASYTGTMFFVQLLMAGVGIWVGYKVGSFEVRINMLISLSILLFVGLKVLFTAIRATAEETEFEPADNKGLLFTALTEGIIPLAIGISIGLFSTFPYLHWLVLGVFLISGILMGLLLASRIAKSSRKLKPGSVSGLLFLAAAIKLILNLTNFGY